MPLEIDADEPTGTRPLTAVWRVKPVVSIEDRKVNPIQPSKSALNGLDNASALLPKKKVTPSKDSLKHAHKESDKPAARLGQLIDILV